MVETALYCQLALWLIVWGVFLASGQASMFHPLCMYLLFHGIVFVVRPFLVHFLGFDAMWVYMGFEPTEQQFVKTLEISSFALIVFASMTILFGSSRTEFGPISAFTREQMIALIVVTVLVLPLVAYSIKSNTSGDV